MAETNNPLLILFWRRERRWYWLRSNTAALCLFGTLLLVALQWGLIAEEMIFFEISVMITFILVIPVSTLVPMGMITQSVKRLRRQGRLSDMLITPMKGSDYIRGLLGPPVLTVGCLQTGIVAIILVHWLSYSPMPDFSRSDFSSTTVLLLICSVVYAWIQVFYSCVVTLRFVIAFQSTMLGEMLAAIVLVGVPFVLMIFIGLSFAVQSVVGWVFLEATLCIIKLVIAGGLLREMIDRFPRLVRVPEFDTRDAA